MCRPADNLLNKLKCLMRFADKSIEEVKTLWGRMMRHEVTPDGRVVARCVHAHAQVEVEQRFNTLGPDTILIETPLTWCVHWTLLQQLATCDSCARTRPRLALEPLVSR